MFKKWFYVCGHFVRLLLELWKNIEIYDAEHQILNTHNDISVSIRLP